MKRPLSPLFIKANSTMRDPRRTVVMVHSNSSSPRPKRWYRVAEACEFEGRLFLHRDYVDTPIEHVPEINGARPYTKADATKQAKTHAEASGNPYMPGTYSGHYGKPLARV